MAFSILNLFKRKAKEEAVVEPEPAPRPVEKSSSARLSKTVMPNSTRTVTPQDSMSAPIAQPQSHMAVMPAPAAPRTVAFAPSEPPKPAGLPPAVAVQLEPTVERAVALELADIVGQMPEGWVRPLKGDEPTRRILLKAAELERGMASGKPSVAISSIYQQAPEIFTRTVKPSDTARVMLPFGKVLDQFTALHVRSDQRPEMAVPQVETPFLKVTTEDSERFGIAATPIAPPSVRVEPATAETLAAAEPEALIREKVAPAAPQRISIPLHPGSNGNGNGNGNGSAPAAPRPAAIPATLPPGPAEPAAPTRIPFKLSPTGTGVPATERVPASSGPPVPKSSPSPTASAPARIPFKLGANNGAAANGAATNGAAKKGEPWITKESFDADPAPQLSVMPPPAASTEVSGPMISLALRPIFMSLPPFQLLGDPSDLPDEARVELPFSIVEPQLVTGRVTITPEQFAAGLPEEFRTLFNPTDSAATVSLPLQEVLKNLPTTSLRMRDDQEEQEQGSAFATPFSAKAEEDAKRLKVAAAPIAKPTVVEPAAPAPAPTPAPAPIEPPRVLPAPAPIALTPAAAAKTPRPELQLAPNTDEALDAKSVVAEVGKMPGVKGCAIIFGDGLSLAGDLPEEFKADGLAAMAPALMQKVAHHMGDSQLGALRAMTLTCANAAITFLTHNDLCLAALHSKEELSVDVRERLASIVQELSQTYSQPA
jgi:predicted regulator of Ras-like GTPase activity (Roadblock/LC7/MglB family)